MFRRLLFISLIGLCGCTTFEPATPPYAIRIKEIDWPLLDLQKLVASTVPTGLRGNSPNGREFNSKYFVLGPSSYKPAVDAVERYTAEVKILGSERPYDLEISVAFERRRGHNGNYEYVVVGHDARLAKELVVKLRSELTKSREDRNIIDDFRAF